MRHAVLAAAIAFRSPLTAGPVPFAARRIARVVMAMLDQRRKRIDGE